MPDLRSRPYAGYRDTAEMQALLRACELETNDDVVGVGSLSWLAAWLQSSELKPSGELHVQHLPGESEYHTRLWEDTGGKLVAIAVYRPSWLLFFLHPQTDDQAVAAEIIAWARERVSAQARTGEESIKLWCQVRADDGRRVTLLEKLGFQREEGNSLRMERPLDQPIPEPLFPSGFAVRSFAGKADAMAWTDLWNDTGPGRSLSIEECLSWRAAPDVVPELDLIALAPDGLFAGYCMGSISEDENAHSGRIDGWTDPIGTRPAFRRLGLARALILTALHGLKARGCERALLGVNGANAPAVQLYESCGYRTLYRKLTYGMVVD